jgi:hypothetical protein
MSPHPWLLQCRLVLDLRGVGIDIMGHHVHLSVSPAMIRPRRLELNDIPRFAWRLPCLVPARVAVVYHSAKAAIQA